MKTLSIATLIAAALTTSTAFAQFGGFQQQGFRHQQNQGFHQQQGFRSHRNRAGFRNQGSGRGHISPALVQGIIDLFDDQPRQTNRHPVNIVGTWRENYNGVQIVHTIEPNGYHRLAYPNGGPSQGHMASYDGQNLRLLNGLYTVTRTSPDVLQLGKTGETRYWTRTADSGSGDGGVLTGTGEITPPLRGTGFPQQLQGRWYAISPEGTQWMYVIRRHSYDMFDFDRQTGQPIMDDGEPVQLLNHSLSYSSDTLTLSPGTDFEDGPFTVQASADGSQLYLTSQDGSDVRMLTRRP